MGRPTSTRRRAAARRPGRPRKVERGAALDAALATFWTRGYAGTSLDHLTAATGLHKPSLYATFGNKARLYETAVDHYVANVGATYLAPLGAPRLRAALDAFFDATIAGVCGRRGPRGCVVACTLPAEAGVSTATRRKLAAVVARLDAAFVARIAAAQTAGEIPADRDPRVLGQVITSGMLALSIRARAGARPDTLRAIADAIVAAVLAP